VTDDRRRIERDLERLVLEELDQPVHGSDPLAENRDNSLIREMLAEYIDEQYGVSLSDEEMVQEATFESIPSLAALVERRMERART
jgi:hypothetical protein